MVTETRPAPTELPLIAQSFDYTPFRESDFKQKGLRTFLRYRDLGLRKASGGLMRADHIRMTGTPDEKTGWHCHDLDFQFVFVLKGHVTFITEDGQTITLRAGDGAHLPPFYRHDEIEFSTDFEVVEITAPADVNTVVGRDAPLPKRATKPNRVAKFAASYDTPDSYKVGDGPRKFLAYRDVAATDATGRRVNINVVRNSKAGDSSTGWHYHSLACQFIFVLKGWSRVEIEGHGEFTVRAGESMTIPSKMKHDVTGFSADFTVLELNIPADYDTVACDPPGDRGKHRAA